MEKENSLNLDEFSLLVKTKDGKMSIYTEIKDPEDVCYIIAYVFTTLIGNAETSKEIKDLKQFIREFLKDKNITLN